MKYFKVQISLAPTSESQVGMWTIELKSTDQQSKYEKGPENLSTVASIAVIVQAPPKTKIIIERVVVHSFDARIKKMDKYGNVTVEFQQPIKVLEEYANWTFLELKKIIDVHVIPNSDQLPENIAIKEYSIVSLKPR